MKRIKRKCRSSFGAAMWMKSLTTSSGSSLILPFALASKHHKSVWRLQVHVKTWLTGGMQWQCIHSQCLTVEHMMSKSL